MYGLRVRSLFGDPPTVTKLGRRIDVAKCFGLFFLNKQSPAKCEPIYRNGELFVSDRLR